jgi:hypothetical protein
MDEYLAKSDQPGFTVYGGTRWEGNAVSATTTMSRRAEQASQYKRRLNPAEVAEVRAILARFPLGEWGPSEDGVAELDSETATG